MKTKLFCLKGSDGRDTTELDEFIKYVEVVNIQYHSLYTGISVQHFAFLIYK